MTRAREIQKNVTRPTSVAVMLVIFQLFQKIWPDVMPVDWQEWTYNVIGIIGATGVLDKAWRYRKDIIDFIKRIFKRKNGTP